jgi:peptidoglycan hydrolase-like protein with peptidoglycan-binding domain
VALQSRLFAGEPKLEAAAISDPAHIVQGAVGVHVSRIQDALNMVDGAGLNSDGMFGSATAAAVLTFKKKRDIINRAYQMQADGIVGKMTMAALDAEVAEAERSSKIDVDGSLCGFSTGDKRNRGFRRS